MLVINATVSQVSLALRVFMDYMAWRDKKESQEHQVIKMF